MPKFILHSILLTFFCFFSASVWATHIVGGEVTYRCLGNNQYEISVTVFRDCDTGVPWFDNPASVGVFDVNNALLMDLRLTLRNNDTLDLQLFDSCYVAPPNVCIHTTTYMDTVTLPYQAGGYQIVYQRCCRNQDIVNIVNPLGTGATYRVFISEEALITCNSSPHFLSWPPVYLCAGVPIVFDHSATDVDGDSIVYELVAPFDGATPQDPMPQPPYNPPYDSVTWQPPFSTNNMLGGPDSFRINPVTGMLSGTPNILGVFVVGIIAREYRNGQLISSVQRDFQYAVGICGRRTNAAFFTPQVVCNNGLLVQFANQSQGSTTSYLWDFGDTTTTADHSVLGNPIYIYPDTGLYNVTLIAEPGSTCSDTFQRQVNVQYYSIAGDFDLNSTGCTNQMSIQATDRTIDTISMIVAWHWDFSNGVTSNAQNPNTVFVAGGVYPISLEVTAANGCRDTILDTLILSIPSVNIADTFAICPNASSVVLNPNGNVTWQYLWSPASFLSATNVPSPVASPPTNTLYNVTITTFNPIDTCVYVDQTLVYHPPPHQVVLQSDTVTCAGSIAAIATDSLAVQYIWWTNPAGTIIGQGGSHVTVNLPSSNTTIYIETLDRYNCPVFDSIVVTASSFPIVADFTDTVFCGNPAQVHFHSLSIDTTHGQIVAWDWNLGNGTHSVSPNPTTFYPATGTYIVELQVLSSAGCIGSVTKPIFVAVPAITSGDTVGICPGQASVVLNPNGSPSSPNLQYLWSPATNLSSVTAASPTTNTSIARTYRVTITSISGTDTCRVVDSVRVIRPSGLLVNVPDITYCGTTAILTATPTRPVVLYEWSGDNSFFTIIGNNNPQYITPTTFPLSGYYVRATDNYGCTATDFALLTQRTTPINVQFNYNIQSCTDTLRVLFHDVTTDTSGTTVISRNWTTSNGQTSTAQNPTFTFTQSQVYTISLTVRLANGCQGTSTQNLSFTVSSLATSSNVVLCGNTTSTVLNSGGSPSLTYAWSPATGLSSTTAASPTATPPSFPFVYTVTITGVNGVDACYAVKTITVSRSSVAINLPPDTTTCATYIQVSAQAQYSTLLQWSFNSNFSPVAATNFNPIGLGLTAGTTTRIYARATDVNGCTAIDSFTATCATGNLIPNVNFTVGQCADRMNISFTSNVTAGSTPPSPVLYWNWDFGNGQTSNAPSATATYTQSGTYPIQLVVQALNGCYGVYEDTLTFDLPTITSADSIGLCGASSVVLNPNGNPNLSYLWSPAGTLSANNVPSPTATPPAGITNYLVTVTAFNSFDTCVAVRSVAVSVGNLAMQAMNDTSICGNQVTLRAFSNSPNTQYAWALDRNIVQVIGLGSPFFTNIHASRWFYVLATDAFGCQARDSVYIQVFPTSLSANFSMSDLSCGDSLRLQFQDRTDTTSNHLAVWNWDFGDGQVSHLPNPTHTYDSSGTYSVSLQVQAQGGCVSTISRPVQVVLTNLPTLTDTLHICGDSVGLNPNVQPSGAIYSWSPSAGLDNPNIPNPMASPSQNTTYTATIWTISNLNGIADTCVNTRTTTVIAGIPPTLTITGNTSVCANHAQLVCVGTNLNTINWSNNHNFNPILATGANLNAFFTGASHWYYVRAQDTTGCTSTDSILVRGGGTSVTLDSPLVICAGNIGTITAHNQNTNDTLTYVWSPSNIILSGQGTNVVTVQPTDTTLVTLIVHNQFGCGDTVQTTILTPVAIGLQVNIDANICDNSASLSASGAGNVSYEWSYDNQFTDILTTDTSLNITLLNEITTFYVRADNGAGCIEIDSVVAFRRLVNIAGDSISLDCPNQTSVSLSAQNLDINDILTYQWQPNSHILSGDTSNVINVLANIGDTYTVIAQNQYGCTASANAILNVSSSIPPLDILASQDTIRKGDTLQLTATLNPNYAYQWGASSSLSATNIFNPVGNPTESTTYTLTITDNSGCTNRDTIHIFVIPTTCGEPYIFVPNAFTPDGDGLNEVLYVRGNNLKDIYFVVYNRWGEKMFETTSQSIGWDGRFGGVWLSPDVYGYYLKCTCENGETYFKKGNVTLFR